MHKETVLQLMLYFMGIFVSSLGLALLIISGVGVAPGDSVAVGLAERTPISVGVFLIIGFVALVMINALIEKKRPRFESIIPSVIRGLTLNFWLYLIFNNQVLDVLWLQWTVFAIGVVCIGLGIAVYLHAPFPHIPVDHFMMVVNENTNQSKRFVRVLFEGVLALIGFVLGGFDVVGWGTLITALMLGPFIQWFYEKTYFLEDIAPPKHRKELME
ncbi:YczE/YyaS/YitT family protein [Pontibacillus halophilus]|nr:hypothetical protein [Pontibacillus halophilus]